MKRVMYRGGWRGGGGGDCGGSVRGGEGERLGNGEGEGR